MATAVKRKPAKKSKAGTCECVALVNKQLADMGCNTRVATELVINFKTGKSRSVLCVPTYKHDPKKRERMKTIVAAYCPFCGKKLGK